MASSFFEGFAQSFSKSVDQRRLRDQLRLEDERERRREAIQQERFQEQQKLQRDQFQALEQFRTKQNEMRQQQLLLETRKADLDFAQGFSKVFDPAVPKSARRFLLGSMASRIGVDPKSQQFKDMDALVSGLDDETLDSLRGTIAAMVPDAQPGQIVDFAKTIMSGKMTLPQLTDIVGKMRKEKTREQIIKDMNKTPEGGQQGSQLLAPQSLGEAMPKPGLLEGRKAEIDKIKKRRDAFHDAGLLEDARLEEQKLDDLMKAGEFEPELRGAIKRAEIEQEEAIKLEKPVSPAILRAIGLSGIKMTEGKARELGITTELLDAKTLREVNEKKTAAHTALRQMEELREMIKPGAIGPVGTFARATNAFLEQAAAIPEASGMTPAQFNKAVRGMIPKELATQSAVIRSRVIDLSFNLAKAVDDGRMSNQDVERFATALGESGSESQFIAVLDDMKERIRSGAASSIEGLTGVKPLDLMTSSELREGIEAVEDADMRRAIIKEQERRLKGKK